MIITSEDQPDIDSFFQAENVHATNVTRDADVTGQLGYDNRRPLLEL